MIWIIASILCSSVLFLLFKFFDRFKTDLFSVVVFNYLFASLTGLLIFQPSLQNIINCSRCLTFSMITGGLFISLFVLISYVTVKQGASISVIASKMALLIPILLSIIIYDEALSASLITGIIISIPALFLTAKKENNTIKNYLWPIVLFLGSGLLDFCLKVGQKQILDQWSEQELTSITFLSSFICGLLYGSISGKLKWSKKVILFGVLLGVPNFFSIFFLFNALSAFPNDAAIIFPLNNIGIILITSLFALLLFKEKISKTNFLGILLCIVAIVLISING